MPVRIIGMIGVTPPAHSATLLVIEGAISPSFIVDFAQAHEAAGFDMVLVGHTSSSAEGFLVAMHAELALKSYRIWSLIGPASWRPPCSRARWQPSISSPAAASRCTSSPARPMPNRKETATSHPRPSATRGRRSICIW